MITNIFLTFFGISVSVSLIVAVLVLLTPFLNKRYAAKWKYLIWIVLAVRLLLPFNGMDMWSAIDMLPQMKTQNVWQPDEKDMDTPADAAAPQRRVIVELPTQMTTPIAMQSEKRGGDITLLGIIAFVWMTGSLTVLSVHLISYFHFKRQVMKKGTVIKNTRILRQMLELKRELHIKCLVRAVEYPEASSPMIIGFLKPVLVLPREQYNAEELFFILKHEMVHLKRGDVYFKLLFAAAAAVHWFNPLIWIMQKEAAVDMELSCDERVTWGTNYAVRKAYTETLLAILHKRYTKKTILSTQFYGGKQIMKKRFKNILIRKGKKNGFSILICAVILTIGLGTLVGFQVAAKENTEVSDANSTPDALSDGNGVLDASAADGNGALDASAAADGNGALDASAAAADNSAPGELSADNSTLENTMMLTFFKEGIEQQKKATLMIGNGYSLYLPDGEWQQIDSDTWAMAVNEQVQLWVTHFEGESIGDIEKELDNDGYVTEQEYDKWKQEGDFIYNVTLKEFENDVWGVFYRYPIEAAEGWGRELQVIADTFAVSAAADNE